MAETDVCPGAEEGHGERKPRCRRVVPGPSRCGAGAARSGAGGGALPSPLPPPWALCSPPAPSGVRPPARPGCVCAEGAGAEKPVRSGLSYSRREE